MKITLKQLRSIIKEEVTRSLLNEAFTTEEEENEALQRLSALHKEMEKLHFPGPGDDPHDLADFWSAWREIDSKMEAIKNDLRTDEDQEKVDAKKEKDKKSSQEFNKKMAASKAAASKDNDYEDERSYVGHPRTAKPAK